MKTSCELVTERVALGEPLGELAEHAATCASCQRLVALPSELGVVHREIDPGLGFTARMTLGAQHRLVARRRRRIAVAGSALVAAAGVAVLVVTRTPAPAPVAAVPDRPTPQPAVADHDPWRDPAPTPAPDRAAAADSDARALLSLARVERSLHASASWGRVTKPLAPYHSLVKGITP